MKNRTVYGWAVMNTDLNELCATGVWDEDKIQLNGVGSAIFDSRGEAVQYRKQFKNLTLSSVIKIIRVKIIEVKGKKK